MNVGWIVLGICLVFVVGVALPLIIKRESDRTPLPQQPQIDRLLAEVAAVREQLRSAVPAEQPGPRDELPPHW